MLQQFFRRGLQHFPPATEWFGELENERFFQ